MRTFNFPLVTALFVFLALGWTSGSDSRHGFSDKSVRRSGGESVQGSSGQSGPQYQLAELTPVASAEDVPQ